jgi:predicted enzyme related to lactoylglutathione lyase
VERAIGIGGVFVRSAQPDRLRAWYAEHLGIDLEEWGGTVFSSTGGETLVWAVFAGDTDYFGSREQQVMVNYRVHDLDAMLAQLRDAGVTVDGPMEHENGRFGWGTDCDGNRFELWQPVAGR